MKKEEAERLNEIYKNNQLIKRACESYLSKEELIKFIENLEFKRVENFTLDTITGYEIKTNNNGDKYVQPLGYKIEIN